MQPRQGKPLLLLFLLLLPAALSKPPSPDLPTAATTTRHDEDLLPYTSRYPSVFLWHALSATLAWTVLTPLSHVAARLQRAHPQTSLQLHRAAMLLVLVLTVQTYLVALFNASSETPPQHAALGTLLLAACLMQAVAGALRPERKEGCPWRAKWARCHRAFGLIIMALAFFVVHHSLRIFQVQGWWRWAVEVCLGVGGLSVVAAQVVGGRYVDEQQSWKLPGNEDDRLDILETGAVLDEDDTDELPVR